MEKLHIDRRVAQMEAEGVVFRTGVRVGERPLEDSITDWSSDVISATDLQAQFDAVVIAGGAERSRDLPVPGRDLDGIHFAMEFLPQQNKVNAGCTSEADPADGRTSWSSARRHRSDCVGTATGTARRP